VVYYVLVVGDKIFYGCGLFIVLGIGFIILCCFDLEFSCWNSCVRFMFIVLLFCVVCAVWLSWIIMLVGGDCLCLCYSLYAVYHYFCLLFYWMFVWFKYLLLVMFYVLFVMVCGFVDDIVFIIGCV